MTARRLALLAALWLPVLGLAAARAGEPREQVDFFEGKIRPALVTHCYSCHSAGAKKVRGGLRLDTRDLARKGGDTGPAVVPGDPAKSLLLQALRYGDLKMPPDRKLPDAVVKDFETWIKSGAADPRESVAAAPPPAPLDAEAGKRFWAFQPPQSHPAPAVRDGANALRKIDAFLLARLEQAGVEPAPPADRRTLLRRVTFDLTGLPPTPAEAEAFVNDPAPDAYEKCVERLLARPAYGERWARFWLDVARYAEDQAHIVGDDKSLTYPNAYLYRDWVIKALNDDVPYDRFVTLQLAADLVESPASPNLPALGFVGLGPKYYDRGRLAVMAEEWEDRVDVVGRGLLGLTVACARCHDHKYDPIKTEDYYGLAGVFASTKLYNRPLAGAKGTEDAKQPKDAMHVVREGTPTDLAVFLRGDVNSKGAVVPRHFVSVLSDTSAKPFRQGSGRRELAAAVTDRHNPLTARVIVNRVWAAYFGRGLVATPANFGALGERPTHPELLDDLAVRFMDGGWSLKSLHREIVLSAAYRRSSSTEYSVRSTQTDPQNLLLAHMPRRRLGVEAWRDAVLAASGRLSRAVGGQSLDPLDPKEARRTVYSRVSRLELNRLLALFDFPDPNVTADRRVETTTPLQKMFVLNSPFMVAQAEALAGRLAAEVPGDDGRRIDAAYRLLYGRAPGDAETRLGREFLSRGADRKARWPQYAHVLLAANEMMFVD